MKTVTVTSHFTTGLRPEFDTVRSVEIINAGPRSGNFGDVYICESVNGQKTFPGQVVKIFREKFPGSLSHNETTILKLQKKIAERDKLLKQSGNKGITELYPAFLAAPQFSFKGVLDGIQVTGFCANNLADLGFIDFDEVKEGSPFFDVYMDLPIEKRLMIAYSLVSGFKVLEEFGFIHADIKHSALFVNLSNHQCAVIDFDSGVVAESPTDSPNTWGAKGDWVAPEISVQVDNAKSGEKIKVDLFTDRWSVMIGVHYLLTTLNPLFFLVELGPMHIRDYLRTSKWPYADISADYFCKDSADIYKTYVHLINKEIPAPVREKLAQTINWGYHNASARCSYKEWEKAIESGFVQPEIKKFDSDTDEVIESLEVCLVWETINSISVEIDNGIGKVAVSGQVKVKPAKSTTYTLKATGHYGNISRSRFIKVYPLPKFDTVKITIPEICSALRFNMPVFTYQPLDYSGLLPAFERPEPAQLHIYPQINNGRRTQQPIPNEELCSISAMFEMVKSKLKDAKIQV